MAQSRQLPHIHSFAGFIPRPLVALLSSLCLFQFPDQQEVDGRANGDNSGKLAKTLPRWRYRALENVGSNQKLQSQRQGMPETYPRGSEPSVTPLEKHTVAGIDHESTYAADKNDDSGDSFQKVGRVFRQHRDDVMHG